MDGYHDLMYYLQYSCIKTCYQRHVEDIEVIAEHCRIPKEKARELLNTVKKELPW